MTLQQIKDAIAAGKTVHWANTGYIVHKSNYEYSITFKYNDSSIGLTHMDGVTMNGAEDQFFIAGSK